MNEIQWTVGIGAFSLLISWVAGIEAVDPLIIPIIIIWIGGVIAIKINRNKK